MSSGVASADEATCVNTVNKNAAKVAKAQSKDIAKCIKDGGNNKLTGTIEQCITSDRKDKVDKAAGKLNEKVGEDCQGITPTIPPIDVSDPNALTQIMIDKELTLIHDIFGTDLDAPGLIVNKNDNKDGWKCQAAVAKAVGKCQDAKLATYNSCKKVQLKAGLQDAGQLQYACMGTNGPPTHGIPDGKGKIAKKCGNGLGGTISKRCGTTDNQLLFPSWDPNSGTLGEFIDQKIECQVCRALNALDGLERNCEEFDDGVVNASCGGRFVDNGDGTITDPATGLMWEKKDDNNAGGLHDVHNTYTWSSTGIDPDGTAFTVFLNTMNNYCDGDETTSCTADADCTGIGNGLCGHAGYRDWRLPEVHQDGGAEELELLIDLSQAGAPYTFTEFRSPCSPLCTVLTCSCTASLLPYWSATSWASYPFHAWLVTFHDGHVWHSVKSNSPYVRAVRGGL
jgi:hypothetical protein